MNATPDPGGAPVKSPLLRNAGITAAILLAPGGFILGGILLGRAIRKRREAQAAQAPDHGDAAPD